MVNRMFDNAGILVAEHNVIFTPNGPSSSPFSRMMPGRRLGSGAAGDRQIQASNRNGHLTMMT